MEKAHGSHHPTRPASPSPIALPGSGHQSREDSTTGAPTTPRLDYFPTTGKANESLGDLPSRGESLDNVGLDDHEFDVDVEGGDGDASPQSSRNRMLATSATPAPQPGRLAQMALDHPRIYFAMMGLAGVTPSILGGVTAAELTKQSLGPEDDASDVPSAGAAGALIGLVFGLALMAAMWACRPRPTAGNSTNRR